MSFGTVRMAVAGLTALALLSPARSLRAEENDVVALDRVERDLAELKGRFRLVRDFTERGELSSLERARQRYSEAETQFLLENFEGCAALLQETLDVPEFAKEASYAQGLFYLAESLYQLQSYLEARRYFREAVALIKPGREFQDSIVRLIDLSDRTNDFTGIDQYYAAALRAGAVRPEVTYLYAKWTANRADVPFEQRAIAADADFAKIQPGQNYYAQSRYFRGALAVQRGRLADAAAIFDSILTLPPPTKPDPRFKRVKDLANLALARVYYEQGKLNEAADRYGELARDAADYNDALFETAACYVKMGNYEQALRTSEILLIIGKESAIAPEALVLQANLELKLQRYDKASATFTDVVQTYGPVKDQIRSILLQPDPVKYFDELLNRKEGALDIAKLLPPAAQPFLHTDREVGEARAIAEELDLGRKSVDESQAIASRLINTLAEGKLNLFPQLQEGNSHAIQLSNRLTALESSLVRLQVKLLGDQLPEEVRVRLRELDAEREQLDFKFRQLPQTQEEYEQRRSIFIRSIAELEKNAFDLRRQIQALRAQTVGLDTFWKTTRQERSGTPEDDAEMTSKIQQDLRSLEQLDEIREELSKRIGNEKATAAAQAAGGQLEEDLRRRYRQQLTEMQELIARSLPQVRSENRVLLARVDQARQDVERQQLELSSLRGRMRTKAQERAEQFRKKIVEEQVRLDDYERLVRGVEGDTRHLLGQIAYDSFSRVGRQFYDLVLKADVGLVDVAWARKKDRSDRIASLAKDKETELKALQDRFKEVLSDAE